MNPTRFLAALIAVVLASLCASCMPYFPQQGWHDRYSQAGPAMYGDPPLRAGPGPAWFGYHPPGHELAVDEVRDGLQRRIARSGNTRLKVGNVAEQDSLTISAEIVTVDNSLVQKINIDRRTGTVLQMHGDARAAWRPWGPPYGSLQGGTSAQDDWRGWMPCPFCGVF